MNHRFTTLLATLAFALTACVHPPKPGPARLAADARKLDELQATFTSTTELVGPKSWRASKRLADERGPAIIHAVMERSRTWRGEEGLIFVPLVALLPREPTLKLLKHYKHSSHKFERIWASEFHYEIATEDVKDAVRQWGKPGGLDGN